MADKKPKETPPEEIADTLHHCLQSFTDPNNHAEIDANKMMEVAFDCLRKIKGLEQKRRISCVWRMTQLGAFPLVVAAMKPGHITFSLSCTLLGVVLADDDLLSHKIGKTLVNDQNFLKAVQAGLTPASNDNGNSAQTAMLVAQMLKNVLKTGSAEMLFKVCHAGNIIELFASVLQQASTGLHQMDWRFVYTVADMLMVIDVVPTNAQHLDNHNVGLSALQLLATITPSKQKKEVAAVLFEKLHLIHRLNCILLSWLGRQSIIEENTSSLVSEIAQTIKQHPNTAESTDSIATQGPHSLRAVAHALEGLIAGSFNEYQLCKNALGFLVRDWSAVEKNAEGVVRSDDFKRKVEEEKVTTVRHQGNPKMKNILKTKEQGNICFKDKKFPEALKIYKQALKELKEQQELDAGPEDSIVIELEEARICNNIANVCLKLELFDEAEDFATDAIDADPTQVKGYYRRAKAHEGKGDETEAIGDLQVLLKLEPQNVAAQAMLADLQKK